MKNYDFEDECMKHEKRAKRKMARNSKQIVLLAMLLILIISVAYHAGAVKAHAEALRDAPPRRYGLRL